MTLSMDGRGDDGPSDATPPEVSRRSFILAAGGSLLLGTRLSPFLAGTSNRLDLGFATARATVDAIGRKQISARELVEATFERIDLYNPRLNAIVVEFRDRAIARARAADEAQAHGKIWGPLHGLPVTIKEAFAYAGSPNTWGLPDLRNTISEHTAASVERLERAGAIVIGKTNIPKNLASLQTYNEIYGTTNNPWDVTRTPGGSSGGAAAAVATGLGPLSLGSDYGGSIRLPAHLCGVYGHRPTKGAVDLAGHQAGPWDGSENASVDPTDPTVPGPLARDARDLELALRVLARAPRDDAIAWTLQLPPARHKRIREYRIGYVTGIAIGSQGSGPPDRVTGTDFLHEPVAPDLLEVYDRAIAALAKAGAGLERGWPTGIDFRSQQRTMVYFAQSRADVGNEEVSRQRKLLETQPENRLALALAGPHRRWLTEVESQLQYRAAWQAYFRDHDVFLMPAAAGTAFLHDHSEPVWDRRIATSGGPVDEGNFNYWSVFASLTGLPATVAPIGRTASGLPVGIQIVGPRWEDSTCIEFAALLADLIGGFAAPPGYKR